MGFAYSLQVFFPDIPIIGVAILAIIIFCIFNILGVNFVGNMQILLGGALLIIFTLFIYFGFTRPGGFSWELLVHGNTFFTDHHPGAIFARMMMTIALTYNAYVGFEVIADDAEELASPNRNIPRGILISLTICTLIYSLVSLVTVGTVPMNQLAGSETALTDAVRYFLPGVGVVLMGVAGIIATLTSINSAMLSATREAFTLSRDGSWPRTFSRLSAWRTPVVAILFIGLVSALIAAIGIVDFLSYISSAGYLFVLFWSNLSIVILRKKFPELKRPFMVPFFPLTAYLAAGSCVLIVAFTQPRALLFLLGVLVIFSLFYFSFQGLKRYWSKTSQKLEKRSNRILVPVANPETAKNLVRIASIIAESSYDTSICVFTAVRTSEKLDEKRTQRLISQTRHDPTGLLGHIAQYAQEKNVALFTKIYPTNNLAKGILFEVEHQEQISLVLMGWPGKLDPEILSHHAVNEVVISARTNVAVFLNKELSTIRNILVPVGGGTHSRLGLQIAYSIAQMERAHVNVFRTYPSTYTIEDIHDQLMIVEELISDELGFIPSFISASVETANSVQEGILSECQENHYDLMILGASEEWRSRRYLFGCINDQIAEQANCSVLMVRREESVMMNWLRRQVKWITENNH